MTTAVAMSASLAVERVFSGPGSMVGLASVNVAAPQPSAAAPSPAALIGL